MTGLHSAEMSRRLQDLFRSLHGYDLLSRGVFEEISALVPGGAQGLAQLDDDSLAEVLFQIVNKLRWRRLESVLALHELPHPRYPIGESSTSNDAPPVAMWDPPPGVELALDDWKVLGFDVGFPVGIPSCELTCNADWIEFGLANVHLTAEPTPAGQAWLCRRSSSSTLAATCGPKSA